MNKMESKKDETKFILGLDVSTKTIGIALYEDLGERGRLILLTHVTPKIKPVITNKNEELFKKCDIFDDEFLNKYVDLNITKVIIEEPLLRSNNVNTVGVLLRFNGMISRAVYQKLGIIPDFISSFDARKYAFPELMDIRTHNGKGERYSEREINKKIAEGQKTLFGAYPLKVDKKVVIWDKVSKLESQVTWLYNRSNVLLKENYDMSDSVTCVLGFMSLIGKWLPENRK